MKQDNNSAWRERTERRELLLVAYKFPPMRSISCNRTWAIADGMRKYFDAVHVITTSNRHLLLQDHIDTSSVHVLDARTTDYRTLFQRQKRDAVAGERTKTSLIGNWLARLQSSFPTLYLFGEGNIRYIMNGVRLGETLLSEHPITHIISTFPPYADHLIASRLKHKHPALHWIADFRDLHLDPAQRNLMLRAYQQRMNKKILRMADVVTTVSEGLAEHLKQLHPNVQVLKNGVKKKNLQNVEPYPKFTIAYTGSMFQDKRKPDTILEALRRLLDTGKTVLEDLDLIYAGKDSAVWWPLIGKYGLESIFSDHGMLSRAEAGQIQRRSHMNILLTYSTQSLKGNLTGKLYDYMASRRPVLVVINGPRDPEIESVIANTGAGEVVYHGDTDAAAAVIEKQYNAWKDHGVVKATYSEDAMEALSWEHLLDTFATENALTATIVEV